MPTFIENHPVLKNDLGKPHPSFNTNIDMRPEFKHLIFDLQREYSLREVEVVQDLLSYCATSANYESIQAFFTGRYQA